MMQQELNRLWGSVVASWSITIDTFTLLAQLIVVENGAQSRYQLRLGGIKEMHFKNDGPTHWDHVELTSIELATERSGSEREVTIEFWNGIANARIRSESVNIEPL